VNMVLEKSKKKKKRGDITPPNRRVEKRPAERLGEKTADTLPFKPNSVLGKDGRKTMAKLKGTSQGQRKEEPSDRLHPEKGGGKSGAEGEATLLVNEQLLDERKTTQKKKKKKGSRNKARSKEKKGNVDLHHRRKKERIQRRQ